MTDNEKEVLNIIREHDNPEVALEVAINLAIEFLEKYGVPPCMLSEHHRASA